MNDQTPTATERAEKLQGLGCARKRVEDARFTQGKGNYVDDIQAAGHAVRRFRPLPYGHARIKSIDKDAALAVPGVVAILTAEDLKPLNLHYMPTLAGDVQAVLADEKVLFQNQEVAFVVAEDRYAAADAVELVEVDYEELPALTDRLQGDGSDDAPLLREDIKDKTEGAHGPRKHPQPHLHLGSRRQAGAPNSRARSSAEVVAEELISYQRVHPCPLETCGCVASMDKINGKLTIWGTFQAPHAVRTVASLITNIPEHNIRIVSPDIGGGFGNKVGVYPGYICAARRLDRHRRAGQMGRGPDREPVGDGLCPRLPHDRQDRAPPATAASPGCPAMCSPTTAPSTPAPTRPSSRPGSSTSAPAPTTSRSPMWRSTASIPTRRRAVSPIAARSGSPRRPTSSSG